ncbi:hypothetical protein [Nonomuraea sp. NPDC005650]|uniref:hypothetical protein n=1 Tax=Nonomuraea sp. NPDC005650 TaxID=3157045 RepID=UPI0033ADB541
MVSDHQTTERNLTGRATATYPWLVDGLGRELPRPFDWPALPVLRDLLRSEVAAELRELATPCPDHGTTIDVRCPACVQFGITLRCASIAAGDTSSMPPMPPASVLEAYDREVGDVDQPRPSLLRRALNRVRSAPTA